MRVLTIITGAFFIAAFLYAGIAASGMLIRNRDVAAMPALPWKALIGAGVANIILAAVFTRLQFTQMEQARNFAEAATRTSVATIVTVAFGEAIVIYGLLVQFLGGPDSATYGLMVVGLVTMIATTMAIRPKVRETLLSHLPPPY